ncbi:VENN motif pre-toxin domain-containing protein [Kingella pumchi]|uniref:VENN motif pre-toxin domain-containing protein n=1 Tax=Kingella pumchi TaxID=2779506 RepID=A0ABS9NP15_9NEIS|nr:VENN motif pre-toxin domain-containing protein [Kingella pumchi]MCG6504538.1 VENN motif pre-toxin domain-containing protein [Kingella pumchi]
MGIGAGYGGSLKGSDGFNQSAFGRASQTAGQNMNKGLNYSPTLPQHESGGSQGYTRSVLSEGNITIDGKKTSARALGIHTDSATAHHSADAVPDLQNLLDKQQTIAQSTAAIHSAVGTYRGNRAKAAAEELEKQQAAHEGSLKERNDGSYEHYLSLSDAQRQQELLAHSPAYAQAYQEARSWGIGGSKSRALSAAETLITGALGGQGDLQLAANTLAPYAAAAIGKRFGHGENKNEAAQAIGHFMLGAALAYANGADPLAGGSAAVAAERAAGYLAKQYDDGKIAIDPTTGKFNPNLLPEHIKEEIKAQTGAIASVVGAAGGSLKGSGSTNGNSNALFNAQVGGVLGQNAVENNALLPNIHEHKKLSPTGQKIQNYLLSKGVASINSILQQYAKCQNDDCRRKVQTAHLNNEALAQYFILEGIRTRKFTIEQVSDYMARDLRTLAHSDSLKGSDMQPIGNAYGYEPKGYESLTNIQAGGIGTMGTAELNQIISQYFHTKNKGLTPNELVVVNNGLRIMYDAEQQKAGYSALINAVKTGDFTSPELRQAALLLLIHGAHNKLSNSLNNRIVGKKNIDRNKYPIDYGEPFKAKRNHDDLNTRKNLKNFNDEIHKKIYNQDPRRIETVKAEVPSGKAVPVGEARIPPNLQAVKGTTVTLAQEQRLANGELIPRGSVVTWSDNAVKVVRPDGSKRVFSSRDWEQKALPKPPKDYRDDINIGRNNPKYNQQRHEKIESHNPNRIEAIRQRNAISSAERQADALKRLQTSGRTRLPGQPQKGKPGAAREMSRSDNPNQTAEAFARRYLGRKPTLMERVEGEKLYGGKCVGCWKAQMPDGTFVVYRPAGNASMTKGTTASVDINNPTLNNLNINLKGKPTELKFKFPAR